jgi:hypothetical protein
MKYKLMLLILLIEHAQDEIPGKSWKASFNLESALQVGIETLSYDKIRNSATERSRIFLEFCPERAPI